MKKVLLILFVLAICVLAMPQGVMAATDIKPAVVNANVTAIALDFKVTNPTCGNPAGVWQLQRGLNTLSALTGIKTEVNSSRAWQISAVGLASDHTGSLMSQANHGNFLQALTILQESTNSYVILSGTPVVQTGPPGNLVQNLRYTNLQQSVADLDKALTDYQITITMTCLEL